MPNCGIDLIHNWWILGVMNVTAEQFADKIGRSNIAESVGVGLTAVSNGVTRGRFPAGWYEACRRLASDVGENCPPELFGQKMVSMND